MTTLPAATLREIGDLRLQIICLRAYTRSAAVAAGPEIGRLMAYTLDEMEFVVNEMDPPRPHPRRPWWRHWLWRLVRRHVA